MTRLLALDPGQSTGYSIWYYDAITPPRPIEHGTITGGVTGFARWWAAQVAASRAGVEGRDYPWDEVVSESFVDDGRTRFPDITPVRIEGALAVVWPDTSFQPNGMKSALRDEKIKALGLWWPGEGHAIDSMRHAFAYLKGRGHRPTLMLWPPRKVAA
jgi:hypothetical protein